MEFVSLTPEVADEWDRVVYHSDDGWAFSLASWLEMVTPTWQMENRSFAIRENGRLMAVMPLHWVPAAKRLASSGWGHGGPAIVADVSPTDRRRLCRAVFTHVEEIAVQVGAISINISISPICQSSLDNHWGVNPLVEFGFADNSTHTRVVDLRQTESELWLGLAQDARQQINRARAMGYTVRRCSWKDMMDEYYRVHVETYTRTGVKPHPKAYFEGIANQPGEHFVLWGGFAPNGAPIAFHNDARFGVAALYHTGCSETAHLRSGINYWLFWEAILGAKADGCMWYETGEAFPQAKSGKDKGLTHFKGKFGGELHRFFKGEIKRNIGLPEAAPDLIMQTSVTSPVLGRRVALRNWLQASRDVLVVVIGQRAVGVFEKVLMGLLGVAKRSSLSTAEQHPTLPLNPKTPEAVTNRTRALYSQDGIYKADTVSHLPPATAASYSDVLLKIRLDLVRQIATNAVMLDVCCATGQHLTSFADTIQSGVGVDFSLPYVERANAIKRVNAIHNTNFVCGDAKKLPFSDNYFDVAYSFSALYQIPNVEQVIREIARTLKPGGKCVLDLGNLYSLNTFVSDAYPELPDRCYIPVTAMKKFVRQAGMVLTKHRAYQILPLWSDRPRWLKLLLLPGWTRLMRRECAGKMLDEWISNLPLLKFFAFRHIFVCEKR